MADPMLERLYELFPAYGRSKLAQIALTNELQRRELMAGSSLVCVSLHPANAVTEVTRSFPPFVQWAYAAVCCRVARSPDRRWRLSFGYALPFRSAHPEVLRSRPAAAAMTACTLYPIPFCSAHPEVLRSRPAATGIPTLEVPRAIDARRRGDHRLRRRQPRRWPAPRCPPDAHTVHAHAHVHTHIYIPGAHHRLPQCTHMHMCTCICTHAHMHSRCAPEAPIVRLPSYLHAVSALTDPCIVWHRSLPRAMRSGGVRARSDRRGLLCSGVGAKRGPSRALADLTGLPWLA